MISAAGQKACAEPLPANVAPVIADGKRYTIVELEAIADKDGIKGLR
ncbi:hypothetical protein LP414_27785 [Polaromonas sp. P1(28)-13]|nr:hypothetical protein LP414_27785 [Polaromonas sp. P1(28)-13]